LKAKNSYSRVAGKGSKEANAPRSHSAKKAPKGMNGETGSVNSKAKAFILRRHMISTRPEA